MQKSKIAVILALLGSSCSSGNNDTSGNSKNLSSITGEGQIVDIRNFGITGNGRTDDSNALQAALDSASPGDEIPLLGKTMLITKPLTLDKEGVTLRGPGALRIGGSGKFFAVHVNAQEVTISKVRFENPSAFISDFVRNGCAAGDMAENHTGGVLIMANYARVIQSVFDQMVIGISVRASSATPSNIEIISNTISNMVGTNAECDGGDGIQLVAKNSIVHDNEITQSDDAFSDSGIAILGAQSVGNHISRNRISGGFSRGILVNNNVALNTIPVNAGFQQISLNELTGSGIDVSNATETNVTGNTIDMEPTTTTARTAIRIYQAPYTVAHRNFIVFNSNRAYDAAILVQQSSESRVDSNEIERSNLMSQNYLIANGIQSIGSAQVQIENNKIAAGIADTGVRMATSPQAFVRDNEIRDVENFLMHLSQSENSVVSDNLLIKGLHGISAQSSNQLILEGNSIQQVATTGDGFNLNNSNQATLRFNSVDTPKCSIQNVGSTGMLVYTNTLRYKVQTGGSHYCGSPAAVNAATLTTDNTIVAVP